MKNIRDHFDTNLIFWNEFPDFKIMTHFTDLYSSDRSINHKKSSKIAWAIHMAYHPDSKFYNIPDKLDVIKRDFIKVEAFDWETNTMIYLVDMYKKTVLTQAEQSLISWNETMLLRDRGLKSWYKQEFDKNNEDRDIRTIADLDKQMANTAKFFADYKKILTDIREEQESKKGKIKSESDSDDF
jgi:hypothetical protein